LNEVRESESTCTGWVVSGGSDELLSMDIFLRVWSVVEMGAREGMGVDEVVELPPPGTSGGLCQGEAHWPRWGALGVGK